MQTEFRLAPIFGDHMVLARNKNIRVFGTAESGRRITVHLHDHTASCTAVKGEFEVVLPPLPAGGPYRLTAMDGEHALTFFDVLIGEVYFAGGQSNMEMRLAHAVNGREAVNTADYPEFRYCVYPLQAVLDSETLRKERLTCWKAVKPGSCEDVSAAAFYFAVKLQAELGVPVGIIGCYLGGSPIACWLDEEALCSTAGGQEIFRSYNKRIEGQTEEQIDRNEAEFWARNQAWQRAAELVRRKNPLAVWDDLTRELGVCPWPPPESRKSAFRPCGVASTMVKRIAPYPISGFLYYQGESDFRRPHLYRVLMTTLISFWRDVFLDPSLPFFFVQLPMFNQRDDETNESWALLRHAQEQARLDTRNTGLAVMIDGGEQEDVHPRDKKTVGERLCLQALMAYHIKIDGESPRAISARPEGNAMIVQTSHPLRGVANPRLFEIAGDDGTFYTAEAEISGTCILAVSGSVSEPKSVRYAWVNFGTVDVYGENGLPLAPFCLR